jgi:co-chaperonin GroES (HSP10)
MELLSNPKKIKPFNDVVVRTSSEYNDEIKGESLILTTYVDKRDESRFKARKIEAEVIALPYRLSNKRIHQTDPVYPPTKLYFPGDAIQAQVEVYKRQLGRELQNSELKAFRKKYNSSSYVAEFTRNNDQEIKGSPGDTVWFHYLSLGEDSYIGQDKDHNRYYKVPYDNVFCFSNNKGVTMANGYVLVDPYWDEDYEDIEVDGKIIKGKLKENLIVSTKSVPEMGTGVIHEKGEDFGEDSRPTLENGDVVLFRKNSEFTNVIMGREVMVMRQWQIIAKRSGNKFVPVGNYVQLRTRKIPQKRIIIADAQKHKVAGEFTDIVSIKKDLKYLVEPLGDVIAVGENCQYVTEGKTVYFNTAAEVFNLEDTIFIREGEIVYEQ